MDSNAGRFVEEKSAEAWMQTLELGETVNHHIDDAGRFQSDRHPDLPPDKIILSFHDPEARRALVVFAAVCKDVELAEGVAERLASISREQTG